MLPFSIAQRRHLEAAVRRSSEPPPILPGAAADTCHNLAQHEQYEPPSLPMLDVEHVAATTDEESVSENEESKRLTRKRPRVVFHAEKEQDDGKVDTEEAKKLRTGNKEMTKMKDTREHILMSAPLKKKINSKENDKKLTSPQCRSQLSWNKMFTRFKKYEAEKGHTTDTKEASCLYSWTFCQRQFYQKWISCKSWEDQNLSRVWKETVQDRIIQLSSTGFVWCVAPEKKWNDMFLQLVEYKKVNGHTNVPKESELGTWVRAQRTGLRYKGNGRPWEKQRIDALNKIDFLWEVLDMQWHDMFRQLLEFKKLNGHTNVSIKREKKLGQWVTSQRTRVDNLSQERIDMLNKVGFQWDPRRTSRQISRQAHL
eukprot:CAMPEP_0198283178 /NCGR_PEP_ID=MMETSP1449-20131203/2844_1 /TAXON_ID=420275 /ORGANISM="Attheya septentrionalis, Strain CCMP2084" /LENGTH=368 /DNA_ID=CAMNT_0043979707 /DNA_START=113 /DNA_END=1219 /DNA_ORIENTATION=-